MIVYQKVYRIYQKVDEYVSPSHILYAGKYDIQKIVYQFA